MRKKVYVMLILLLFVVVACKKSRETFPDEIDNSNINPNFELSNPLFPIYVTATANDESIIKFFNEFATEKDAILFFHSSVENDARKYEEALAKVKKGKIVQNIPSWQTTEEYEEYYESKIDCINYDLEKWDRSKNEWEDIAGSSKKMKGIAQRNGWCYYAWLSGQLSENFPDAVEDINLYSDGYTVGVQGFFERYSQPEEYVSWLREKAKRAKAVNPDIEIIITFNLNEGGIPNDDPALVLKMINDSKDFADSVSFFVLKKSPGGFERLKTIVNSLRSE